MTVARATRFPIRFDRLYRALSMLLGIPSSQAYVELVDEEVRVHMGWAFQARFPRASVAGARISSQRPLSRGVHGFGGRWLVNGSSRGLVELALAPPQRARVLGISVRLKQLWVSLEDPEGGITALGP